MSRFFLCCMQGRIQDFKLEGAHLEKLRRAEGGAKIVGVFRVKNHDFTPKNHIFSNFRGGARRVRPPWIRPWYVYIFIAIVKQIIKRGRVVIQSNCLTLKQVCVRILTLSVPDEDYSRHASCTWNQISTFVFTSHEYVPFVVITIRSFPHSCLITGFVIRVTKRVARVEKELHSLPEHLYSPPIFSGVRVAQSLVFCVVFCQIVVYPFVLFLLMSVLLQLRLLIKSFISSNFSFYRQMLWSICIQ